MNRSHQHLADILLQIERLEAIEQRGYDAFLSNVDTRAAVQRYFEIIGEIVKRLPENLTAKHPHIPWRSIAGMRDIIIHDYDVVMDDTLWNTIKQHLPELKNAVLAMMQATEDQT